MKPNQEIEDILDARRGNRDQTKDMVSGIITNGRKEALEKFKEKRRNRILCIRDEEAENGRLPFMRDLNLLQMKHSLPTLRMKLSMLRLGLWLRPKIWEKGSRNEQLCTPFENGFRCMCQPVPAV